jgi:hypothetical protein
MTLLLAPRLFNLVDGSNRRNVLCCIGASPPVNICWMRHRTACAVPLAWMLGGSDEASGVWLPIVKDSQPVRLSVSFLFQSLTPSYR